MKKGIYIVLFLALFSVSAFSQVGEIKKNLAIGANAGALYNNVTFVPRIAQTGYFGYLAGGSIRYICERYMGMLCGVQLEANYLNKGWKEENGFRRKMDYVEVPFLAHLAFGKKKVRGVLNLGPQFSFLLHEKDFNNYDSSVYSHNYKADKSLDYGIVGGLGVEFVGGRGHYLLEARYYFGLSDIYNNGKTDYYSRSAHNTISLKITYFYDILK